MPRLKQDFFRRPCEAVARDLVGKVLVFRGRRMRISETECYCGESDTACHASRGRTRNTALLHPSQQLVFDTQTENMLLTDIPSAERSINWIHGRFSFEHSTFEEIVRELTRYYNVDIRFQDDGLRQMRFSGDFQVEDGIYHIMSVLQLTYKFNYRIVGNDIEIYTNTDL